MSVCGFDTTAVEPGNLQACESAAYPPPDAPKKISRVVFAKTFIMRVMESINNG